MRDEEREAALDWGKVLVRGKPDECWGLQASLPADGGVMKDNVGVRGAEEARGESVEFVSLSARGDSFAEAGGRSCCNSAWSWSFSSLRATSSFPTLSMTDES